MLVETGVLKSILSVSEKSSPREKDILSIFLYLLVCIDIVYSEMFIFKYFSMENTSENRRTFYRYSYIEVYPYRLSYAFCHRTGISHI